jgi:hypothetical protein
MADEPKALKVNVDSFANDFKADLRDLLRASIARVMPQEMLDALVKGAVDEFLVDKTIQTDHWSRNNAPTVVPSGLKSAVWELLKEDVKRIAVQYLSTEDWRTQIGNAAAPLIGEKLKAMILELGPQLLLSMFASAVGDHIRQVNDRLNSLGMR